VKRLLLVVLLAAFAPIARAESPRVGSFDFSFGQYRPNIDSEPNLHGNTPWRDVFGTGSPLLFRATASYDITHYFGSLEVGLQTGYLTRSGHGLTLSGTPSSDTTSFRMIPTSAVLTYRFDLLADRYNIPFAPYGRLAFERYNWWVTNGSGGTSKYGATNGWSAAAGLALMLDFFDPYLARELDRETGINHTYLFAEARKTKVNDFGSSTSWDLSGTGAVQWAFGMLFVF
jgi:hypothetical protein